MAKKIFLKKRRTTWDIFQYWSVFSGILGKSGQYLVSILGKSGQYSGQYTDFFLQTTVVITEYRLNMLMLASFSHSNLFSISYRSQHTAMRHLNWSVSTFCRASLEMEWFGSKAWFPLIRSWRCSTSSSTLNSHRNSSCWLFLSPYFTYPLQVRFSLSPDSTYV